MFAELLESIQCSGIAESNLIFNYFDVASGNMKQ